MINQLWGEPDSHGIMTLLPEPVEAIRQAFDPNLPEMRLEISIFTGAGLGIHGSAAITFTLKWDGKPSLSIPGHIDFWAIEAMAKGDATDPRILEYTGRIKQTFTRLNERKAQAEG